MVKPVQRQGPNAERELDPVWRALSNAMRRRMLDLLREHPMTTGALAAQFPGHSRFAVMQHLAVLEDGGLVVHRRDGRTRINYLNPIPIQQIYNRWVSQYEGTWTDALIALKDDVETKATHHGKSKIRAA